jgi:deferrochelatase/peroxidase EfeB
VGATNFQTTLSAVSPAVPGVSLTVIENGSRLQLRNDTSTDVVIAGYGGEPYARVGPGGAFLNDNSPATYLNADRFSRTQVPAGVDGKSAPVWRQVSTDPLLRWHDHRVHWMLQSLPPSVVADPGAPHRISAWTVVLDYAGTRLVANGTLDWVPGPAPWPWFALALLAGLAVAAAVWERRPHRVLAVAVAGLVVLDLAHGLGVMLVVAGTVPERLGALVGSDALLAWPFAVLGAGLLWREHTRAAWLTAVVGLVTAVNLAIDDAPAVWRSSAPTAWPSAVNRAIVALVVGIGLGLVAALPLLLRRHPPESRPWQPPAAPPRATSPGADEPDPEADGRDPAKVGRRQVAGYLAAGALGAIAGSAVGAIAARPTSSATSPPAGTPLSDVGARTVAFFGSRQAGIATPVRPQAHVWVAGFDLVPGADATALRELLRRWSEAGAKLAAGQALGGTDDAVIAGLGPAALTVTVGFGPSLFGKAGIPASARPQALAPLPAFAGETLDPARGDGDLGLVVAADDAVVVAHAARVLRRLASGVAVARWHLGGFNAARGGGSDTATPRNLMGQVDGTNNPRPTDPDFAARIFVSDQAEPAWLRGGSYLVVRRIRMLLDDWDGLPLAAQERVIGRRKDSGAPLSGGAERTAPNYGALGPDGAPLIAPTAHMRLAAPAFNNGAAILRRGFSYVDGDEAGLLFLAWQADPRHGFIPVQQRLVQSDALGRYIRHESSALFAMPGGAAQGGYVGRGLVEDP